MVSEMIERAEVAPELDLTVENWDKEFGEDGVVQTPLGKVKMGGESVCEIVETEKRRLFGDDKAYSGESGRNN